MSDFPKRIQMTFAGAGPMQFSETQDIADPEEPSARLDSMAPVRLAMRAYLKAAKELLEGKYKHLAHLAPEHLSNTGNVLVLVCSDGIVIRYDDVYNNAKAVIENLLGPLWDPGGDTQIYYPARV